MASNQTDSGSDSSSTPEENLFTRANRNLLNSLEASAAIVHGQEQAEFAVLRQQRGTAPSPIPEQPRTSPSPIPEDGSSSPLEDLESFDDSSQDKTVEPECFTADSSEERCERRSKRSRKKRKPTPQPALPAEKTRINKRKSIFYIFIILLI